MSRQIGMRTLCAFQDGFVHRQPGRVFQVPVATARKWYLRGVAEVADKGAVTAAVGRLMARTSNYPADPYSHVTRAWQGQTVALLGGGPSLNLDDIVLAQRAGCKVLAINDAYKLAPDADALYFADLRWWGWHRRSDQFRSFTGQVVTIVNESLQEQEPHLHCLRRGSTHGLSDQSNTIATGANGGYQALNIAYLAGAKRVLLLGYDMRAVDGRTHWHGGHPVATPTSTYARLMIPRFESTLAPLRAAGVEVINCTQGSALPYYEMRRLQDAL